jgi:hypothetical protein
MRGLGLDPDHEGLKAEVRRMGIRKPRAFPFLDRAHPLNKVAGQLGGRRKTNGRK